MQQFSIYYPDVCLQLNMFRAFSRPSSGAQWLQWQPLVLPSYRDDSRAVFVVGPARPRTQHNYHHDTDFYISNLRVKLICYLYLPTQNICLHRQVFKHYRIFPKISKANTVEELTFHLPVPETHNKASSTYRTEY